MLCHTPPILTAFAAASPSAPFNPADARLVLTRPDDASGRPDDGPLSQVDWPLATLAARGYDGACLLIGNATLRMLHYAHPAVFAAHPGLTPPPAHVSNTYVLAHELIQRSRSDQTDRYLDAIDHLVQHLATHPAEVGHASLPVLWPDIRRELIRHGE